VLPIHPSNLTVSVPFFLFFFLGLKAQTRGLTRNLTVLAEGLPPTLTSQQFLEFILSLKVGDVISATMALDTRSGERFGVGHVVAEPPIARALCALVNVFIDGKRVRFDIACSTKFRPVAGARFAKMFSRLTASTILGITNLHPSVTAAQLKEEVFEDATNVQVYVTRKGASKTYVLILPIILVSYWQRNPNCLSMFSLITEFMSHFQSTLFDSSWC
jgi:hypothetical protein